jgi:hypothetical protein
MDLQLGNFLIWDYLGLEAKSNSNDCSLVVARAVTSSYSHFYVIHESEYLDFSFH